MLFVKVVYGAFGQVFREGSISDGLSPLRDREIPCNAGAGIIQKIV
jgi:hypothetical protein